METEHIPKEDLEGFWERIEKQPGNTTCFDCQARGPTWASATFGVLICYSCSSNHRHIGTHISFVRSIRHDDWQVAHVRNVRAGGNRFAREWWTRNGGAKLLNSGTPVNEKYTSRTAKAYLVELSKRVEADRAKFPGVEGALDLSGAAFLKPEATSSQSSVASSKDDFFASFATSKKTTPLATPPISSNSPAPEPATVVPKKTASKPISRSILGGTKKPMGKPKASKKTKAPEIDFDSLEREAEAEKKREKELGYVPEPVSTSASAPASSQKTGRIPGSTSSNSAEMNGNDDDTAFAAEDEPPQQEFRRFGFGQTAASAPPQPAQVQTKKYVDNYDASRSELAQKFGSAKGISSDDVFGRNKPDEAAAERLRGFQNATSISSASYFGREDVPLPPQDGDFAATARNLAARAEHAAQNMDFEDVKNVLEQGATKLGEYMRSYLH